MDYYIPTKNTEKENQKIAVYRKLSPAAMTEDGNRKVQEQEKKLVQFLQEQGINAQAAPVYIDKDAQNQPEFHRLINDVRCGDISCIAVTELSQFGRDYMERGRYLTSIFPRLGIRFLSMEEDYDSDRPEDVEKLRRPIDRERKADFARKLSERIRAAKEEQAKRGEVVLSRAPYGYQRTEDRRNLIVDEKVSAYVKVIFQWTMLGVGKQEIARRMNLLGVATPGQYMETGKPTVELTETKWTSGTVQKILQNPCYTGDIVTGRIKQSDEKGKKQYKTAQDTWFIQKDRHAPFVPRDDYEILTEHEEENAQKIHDWRKQHEEEYKKYPDLFQGLVFCAQCGRRMHYRHYSHNAKTESIAGACYQCAGTHAASVCTRSRIDANLIKIVAFDKLREAAAELEGRKERDKIQFNEQNAELHARQKAMEKELKEQEEHFLQLCTAIDQIDTEGGAKTRQKLLGEREQLISEIQDTKQNLEITGQEIRIFQKNWNSYQQELTALSKYAAQSDLDSNWIRKYIYRIEINTDGANADINVLFQYPEFPKIN